MSSSSDRDGRPLDLAEPAGGDRPVTTSLPEFVYRELRDAILDGVFSPGEMLRQDEVASRLGVSRSPLREAMPRLEAEGLVVLKPRRGYAVASMETEDVIEVFDLRCLIEGDVATLACARRNDADIEAVRVTVAKMDRIAEDPSASDLGTWFQLNALLHDQLLMPARRPHHLRALHNCYGLIEAYIRMEVRFTGNLSEAQAEHRSLAKAFIDGDGVALAELMRQHGLHTRDRLLRGLAGRFRPRRVDA